MRDDGLFEIDRAFDLLPHVVGASWATTWFRINGIRSPSAEEFRERAAAYFEMLDGLCGSLGEEGASREATGRIRKRRDRELERIRGGLNEEIEKRHRRYVDYG